MGCLRADGAEPKPCAAIVRRRKQAIHLLGLSGINRCI